MCTSEELVAVPLTSTYILKAGREAQHRQQQTQARTEAGDNAFRTCEVGGGTVHAMSQRNEFGLRVGRAERRQESHTTRWDSP